MESLGGRFDCAYQDAQNGCGYSNSLGWQLHLANPKSGSSAYKPQGAASLEHAGPILISGPRVNFG